MLTPTTINLMHAANALVTYSATSLAILLGIGLGKSFVRSPSQPMPPRVGLTDRLANWDGAWYASIAREGYDYRENAQSNVAFFPVFPLLGRWLAAGSGMTPEAALVSVAHGSLLITFLIFTIYAGSRTGIAAGANWPVWPLLAFAVWPPAFFCRMAYSESLFLLFTVTAVFGMERRWPLMVISIIIGLATATRSLGICLLLPFGCHLWNTSDNGAQTLRRAWLLGVACWGLLAFACFQYAQFGDALAFVRTQEYWSMRDRVSWPSKCADLVTLEPLRAVFDSDSPCCWHSRSSERNPLFSFHFANPIFWLAAVALVACGIWKDWLSRYEWSLALGLLFVPYVLRGHEMCMAGMGRFTAVVFPIYIVLGHLLSRLPTALGASLLVLSGSLMVWYAILFTMGFRVV